MRMTVLRHFVIMDEFYIYQNAIWRANAEQQSEVKSLKITANNPFEIHILIVAALLKFQLEFCVSSLLGS